MWLEKTDVNYISYIQFDYVYIYMFRKQNAANRCKTVSGNKYSE